MPHSGEIAQELEKSINETIKQLAHTVAETSAPQQPLENLEVREKKIEHEFSQYMLYAKKRCIDGFFSCLSVVKDLARLDEQINIAVLELNVKTAFASFDSVAAANELSFHAGKGTSWKDLLGITDTSLQLLYQGAKYLIDTGFYPEAEAAFFFLTTLDYRQYAFWLGLGHSAAQLGNFYQSINAYEMAEGCEPNSCWPSIYMANCFERRNDHQEVLLALEKAYAIYQSGSQNDLELGQSLHDRIVKTKILCSH